MPGLRADVDPDGLLEFSVVYTDRALNHMSACFQGVMQDVLSILKSVYAAEAAVVVPGSGTFAMESVARQFANGRRCMVMQNGWFSYRWSQIFEQGDIPASSLVLKARPLSGEPRAPFAPPPIDEVLGKIDNLRPDLVFAPHVETSSGMLLPDPYLRAVADAVHEHGGLFVLDCVASGTLWVDMQASGVDILISAPQKGWSGSPCAGFVMLSEAALAAMDGTRSTSFACDLAIWLDIARAYETGSHAYHATMPTDALRRSRDAMLEARSAGFERLRDSQVLLGKRVRELLASHGFASVAAPGFEAPGVVVCYTDDPDISSGAKFAAQGLQIAAGVPLRCGEPEDFRTFRLGLFGLDKLADIDGTVATLDNVLERIRN